MTDQIGHSVPLMTRRNRRVWLAKRRHVLGATDAVAVLGFSRFKTPLDVWMDKTGRVEPENLDDKYVVQRGNVLEALIVTEWVRRNDATLLRHAPLLGHPDYPFLAASLDAAALIDNQQVVGEAKAVTFRARADWWDADVQVPDMYVAQTLIQLAVTGLPVAHVIADVAGEFVQVEILRDLEFEAWALPELETWWVRYVLGDEPCEIDPIRDYPNLRRLWPPDPAVHIEADDELARLIESYQIAARSAKDQKAYTDELRGLIRLAAKEATVITHDGETIATVSKSGALTVKQPNREETTQ